MLFADDFVHVHVVISESRESLQKLIDVVAERLSVRQIIPHRISLYVCICHVLGPAESPHAMRKCNRLD